MNFISPLSPKFCNNATQHNPILNKVCDSSTCALDRISSSNSCHRSLHKSLGSEQEIIMTAKQIPPSAEELGALIVDWPSRTGDKPERGKNSSTSESSSVKRRSVRFVDSTTVRFISFHDTDDNASKWYSRREYEYFKNNAKTVIRAMRRHARRRKKGMEDPMSDDPEYCIRGLENMRSLDVMKNQQMMKDAVIYAVLDEQERQFEAGEAPCPKSLAIASRTNSQWARKIARAVAKRDALEADQLACSDHFQDAFVDAESKKDDLLQMKSHAEEGTLQQELNDSVNSLKLTALEPAPTESTASLSLHDSFRHTASVVDFNDSLKHGPNKVQHRVIQ